MKPKGVEVAERFLVLMAAYFRSVGYVVSFGQTIIRHRRIVNILSRKSIHDWSSLDNQLKRRGAMRVISFGPVRDINSVKPI